MGADHQIGREELRQAVPAVRYEFRDLHEDLSTLARIERGPTPGA